MIKNIKLFINDNEKSRISAELVRTKLIDNGFNLVDEDYDLAIAIGGDGAFLRMIKDNNFNSNIYYIGINAGTLGFAQEVSLEDIDKFILELKEQKYKVEELGVQETTIYTNKKEKYYSLNEIIIRDSNLKLAKLDIYIEDDLLERYAGDGILVSSSFGSTAHNISYGGAIVFNTFHSLQITPIAPINSKVYRTIFNPIIIPDKKKITIIPENNDILLTIDGEHKEYNNIVKIETIIKRKTIKCIRLSHYNFPQKINEKLLGK